MQNLIYVVLAPVLLLAIAWVVWRVASDLHALPCPRWLGFILDNPVAGSEAERQIEQAKLTTGMSVLDAGCGTGRLTLPIACRIAPAGHVLAIDLQLAMLNTVINRAQARRLDNIQTRQVALGEGLFHEEMRFDRAFLTTVLGEIPRQQEALQEIFVALKPGGILSVSEIIVDPHFQIFSKVQRLAEQVGFILEEHIGNPLKYTANFKKP